MKPPLRNLAILLASRRLRRALDEAGPNTLLVLASTRRNLDVALTLARHRPIWVTEGPVTATAFSREGMKDRLLSPARIARLNREARQLARPVVSFPDQVVGDGPSFCTLDCAGEPLSFSLLEALLVRRHRPAVLTLAPIGGLSARPLPVVYDGALGDDDQALLDCLLAPVKATIAQPPADWLAASCLPMKRAGGLDFALREAAKDIVALLRCSLEFTDTDPGVVRQALNTLHPVCMGRHAPA